MYEIGGQDTFESTLFRISTKKRFILVLVYVDDLLIASRDEKEGEAFLQKAHGDLEDQAHWEDPRGVSFSSWGEPSIGKGVGSLH